MRSRSPLDRARRDHVDMIKALRGSRRDELIALTRRHLKPSPEAYIKPMNDASAKPAERGAIRRC